MRPTHPELMAAAASLAALVSAPMAQTTTTTTHHSSPSHTKTQEGHGNLGNGVIVCLLTWGTISYAVTIDSPSGTFDGTPVALYFDSYTIGIPVARATPSIPFHLSSNCQSLATGILTSGGFTDASAPSSDSQGLVLRTQAAVMSPSAANGLHALTDAFDVSIQ